MHKAIVRIYADSTPTPEQKKPAVRGWDQSKMETEPKPVSGLVFETTVTGDDLAAVTYKATSMLEMNLKAEELKAAKAAHATQARGL